MRPIALDTNAYTAFKRGDTEIVSVLRHAPCIILCSTVLGVCTFAGKVLVLARMLVLVLLPVLLVVVVLVTMLVDVEVSSSGGGSSSSTSLGELLRIAGIAAGLGARISLLPNGLGASGGRRSLNMNINRNSSSAANMALAMSRCKRVWRRIACCSGSSLA